MAAFLVKRTSLGLVTLVGVSILVFLLMRAVPGDVVLNVLLGGEGGSKVPQETINAIRHDLGMDKPLAAQYADWVRQVVTGEMGFSYSRKASVGSIIQSVAMPTMQIAVLAVLFSWLFGLPLGVLSALRRNSPVDYLGRLVSILGLAVPGFWLGLLLVMAMATWFHWFPPLTYTAPWDPAKGPWPSFQKTLPPALILAVALMAFVARMTRSSMLEVVQQDYVRTARAKGLGERHVITRHMLKLALLPVLTVSGVHLGMLLSATVVMERVFAVNGLGNLVIEGVLSRDVLIVQNGVLLFAAAFVVINMLTDIAYGWMDPRLRRG